MDSILLVLIVVVAVVAVANYGFTRAEQKRRTERIRVSITERERQKRLAAKRQAEEDEARQEYMRRDAVVARRVAADFQHLDTGRAAVTVRAKAVKRGYIGTVITVTGKELWRCSHVHRSQMHTRPDWDYPVDLGVKEARRCATTELSTDRLHYEELAGQAVGNGVRAKRAPIEYAGFETWGSLLSAFESRCAYCGRREARLHQDHVIPLSRGGRNDFSNVLPACARCNLLKGTRTLGEFLPLLKVNGISIPAWFRGTSRTTTPPPKEEPRVAALAVALDTPELLPPIDLAPQPSVCSTYLKRGDGHCRRCGNHWYLHNKN